MVDAVVGDVGHQRTVVLQFHTCRFADDTQGTIGELGEDAILVRNALRKVMIGIRGRRDIVQGGNQLITVSDARLASVGFVAVATRLTVDQQRRRIGTRIGQPRQRHIMAVQVGGKALHLGCHHVDAYRLHVGQADGRVVVLGMDHQLIRCVADMGIGGVPNELHLGMHAKSRLRVHHGWTDGQFQRCTRNSQGHIVAIGVGSRYDKGELLARHEAVLVVALDLRKVVVASRNQDLHIADDGTNLHAVAPFLHHDGHVILALHERRIPTQFSRDGVDHKSLGGLWQSIARDFYAVLPLTGHQPIAQAVAVRVVGRRIVEIEFAHTAFVDGRIEQLHRVVVTQERVDDQFRLDVHGHHHRIGHVDDAEITVGVFHADGVSTRRGIVMDLFVDVQCIVFAQVLQHHAGNVFLQAVAPLHQ